MNTEVEVEDGERVEGVGNGYEELVVSRSFFAVKAAGVRKKRRERRSTACAGPSSTPWGE